MRLPELGGVAAFWREQLDSGLRSAAEAGLVVDLRSATYVSFWPPPPDLRNRIVTVKVWQSGPDGSRTAVSHFNKASKGALARVLATTPNAPRSPDQLVDVCRAAGWQVELTHSRGTRLDVLLE